MPLDQDQHDALSGVMSLGAHLDELRMRLIKAAIVPVVLAVAVFMNAAYLRAFILQPLIDALEATNQPTNLQVLSPTETIMVDLQLSIWTAVVVSLPWILWQLWRFVAPGLYAHERRYARFLVPLSALLVAVGLTGFYLTLPFMMQMMIGFGTEAPRTVAPPPSALDAAAPRVQVLEKDPASAEAGQVWMLKGDSQLYLAVDAGRGDGQLEVRTVATRTTGSLSQQYRLQEYVDFVIFFALAIAIAFQMPVAVLLLGWIGLLNTRFLRKYRRHAILVCAIVAAVVTPTIDLVSMLGLMIPLYLLYELGIVLLVVAPAQAVAEGGVVRNTLGTLVGRPKYRPRQTDGDEGDE